MKIEYKLALVYFIVVSLILAFVVIDATIKEGNGTLPIGSKCEDGWEKVLLSYEDNVKLCSRGDLYKDVIYIYNKKK